MSKSPFSRGLNVKKAYFTRAIFKSGRFTRACKRRMATLNNYLTFLDSQSFNPSGSVCAKTNILWPDKTMIIQHLNYIYLVLRGSYLTGILKCAVYICFCHTSKFHIVHWQ